MELCDERLVLQVDGLRQLHLQERHQLVLTLAVLTTYVSNKIIGEEDDHESQTFFFFFFLNFFFFGSLKKGNRPFLFMKVKHVLEIT